MKKFVDKTKTIAPKRPTALPEKVEQEEEKKLVEETIPTVVEETNLPSATTTIEE